MKRQLIIILLCKRKAQNGTIQNVPHCINAINTTGPTISWV
jgi:hypothetical protein